MPKKKRKRSGRKKKAVAPRHQWEIQPVWTGVENETEVENEPEAPTVFETKLGKFTVVILGGLTVVFATFSHIEALGAG